MRGRQFLMLVVPSCLMGNVFSFISVFVPVLVLVYALILDFVFVLVFVFYRYDDERTSISDAGGALLFD